MPLGNNVGSCLLASIWRHGCSVAIAFVTTLVQMSHTRYSEKLNLDAQNKFYRAYLLFINMNAIMHTGQ
jgi:hypothetical protein